MGILHSEWPFPALLPKRYIQAPTQHTKQRRLQTAQAGTSSLWPQVLHLFSRLHRRHYFLEKLERAFCLFCGDTDFVAGITSPLSPRTAGVTARTLRRVLRDFGYDSSEEAVQSMICEADADGDGVVGFHEFITAVCCL